MTRLTREQAAILGAYTGVLCGPMADLNAYVNRIMARPVYTHELCVERVATEIAKRARPDFLAMCAADRNNEARHD